MTIWNNGTIYANKDFTPEAIQLLENEIKFDSDLIDCIDEDNLDVEDWCEVCFEDNLQAMIDVLSPLGYIFEGEISYYGDYDGMIVVRNNKIQTVDQEDVGLVTADDGTLIRMLRDRGYQIFKDGTEIKSDNVMEFTTKFGF